MTDSLAISRGLLLVPGCPSWLQIKSLTSLTFESVLTECRRRLLASRAVLPVESVLCTRSNNVCRFHCLAGNSAIILSTVRPFSVHKTLINNRSSSVSGAVFTFTSLMTCNHFRLFNKEYLTTYNNFCVY